jgi:hypothetical protein
MVTKVCFQVGGHTTEQGRYFKGVHVALCWKTMFTLPYSDKLRDTEILRNIVRRWIDKNNFGHGHEWQVSVFDNRCIQNTRLGRL